MKLGEVLASLFAPLYLDLSLRHLTIIIPISTIPADGLRAHN